MKKSVKTPTIGIIGGRGALGAVLVRELRARGNTVLVGSRKKTKETVATVDLLKKSDIVIVSVPLLDTEKILREITPKIRKNQLLTDVTSVKVLPLNIMKEAKGEVVGLHPMFGPVSDVTGLNCYYCPTRPGPLWRYLQSELVSMGLHMIRTTAAAHDRRMTAHQSLHHLLLLSCGAFLGRRDIGVQKLFEETTPSMRLMLLTTGRLLAADPDLYKGIEFLNPHTVQVVEDLRQVVDELAEVVEQRDDTAFDQILSDAAQHFGTFSQYAQAETNRLFGSTKNAERPIVHFSTGKQGRNIAILGPATQTELAAAEIATKAKLAVTPHYVHDIADVFRAVADGSCALGVIPLENYQIGPVRTTVKNLFVAGGDIRILAELSRPIAHALLGKTKLPKNKIQRIFAHPQAAAQCRAFTQKKYPDAEIVETAHTGESVARAAHDATALAIGPTEAAESYGLLVLQEHIEDDPNNRTRFVVIGKKDIQKFPPTAKTALAFNFKKDAPGNLAEALAIFARHNINLTRIESIPTEKSLGGYFFFTEAAAVETTPAVKTALAELRKIAHLVTLGSYGEIS